MDKKMLIIGDIHGRSNWKNFEDISLLLKSQTFEPDFDKYVFLGDYVDGYDKDNSTIFNNLIDIINFKQAYNDNVVLLLGNHDLQYYMSLPKMNNKFLCSGYRPEAHYDLYTLFHKYKHLFQASYQYGNYIFTHAGIVNEWYRKFEIELALKNTSYNINYSEFNISERINLAFELQLNCLFDIDFYRGGMYNEGGIFWCDKEVSQKTALQGYNQIVGHTIVEKPTTYTINEETTVTYCDCIKNNKYYIIKI